MKNSLLGFLALGLLTLPTLGEAQTGYTLSADIKGLNVPYVYFRKTPVFGAEALNAKLDSVAVKKGHFTIQGKAPHPFMMSVITDKDYRKTKYFGVFVENKPITVKGDFASLPTVKVTGSATHDLYVNYEKSLSSVRTRLDSLNKIYMKAHEAKDTVQEALLQKSREPLYKEYLKIEQAFVKDHPSTVISAFLLSSGMAMSLPLEERENLLRGLDSEVQASAYGKEAAEKIRLDKMGQPGDKAFAFEAVDIQGKPFKLADLKGKYVLMDFWASWCVPCRKNNPHLRKLYEQYQAKGFDVVGISDDDSKPEAWKKAVEKDQLPWHHVLRGYRTDSDLTKHFAIHSLPTYILLDKEGTIIARYSSDHSELDKKLAELMP
ncbi:hypothetical protein BWI93_03755 [Siphonobacter sp. BAB-5385]|uniref:AhpC/TSA family protein n=1 Tax=Siphonobacter sp. BAB-5385 TaxID=1864822 RepID=UPI000B9E77F9|nr:AhpC/TSA family protein [Siphonobacter sp. BAB-5385]OZI09433.1 hypothetical protein BWI93_03755 [Siphonobacter sp. BAB-5385]